MSYDCQHGHGPYELDELDHVTFEGVFGNTRTQDQCPVCGETVDKI